MPLVSKANGGLRPGLRWDDLAAMIEEMDDLDRFGRLDPEFEPTPPPLPARAPGRGGR